MSEVTASVDQMSANATDSSLKLLRDLAKEMQPEDAGLATVTVSNLLGAMESLSRQERNASADSEDVDDAVRASNEAAAARATVIAGVLERAAVAIGRGMIAGERPMTFDTDRFRLAVYVGGPAAFEGSSATAETTGLERTGAASVSVERGTFAGLTVSTAQVVEWHGMGPHFWAGGGLNTSRSWAPEVTAVTRLGSDVLTVSFFNETGGKVDVVGLTQPAVIGLAVEPHLATEGIRSQLELVSAENLRRRAKVYNATGSIDIATADQEELIELLITVPEVAIAASAVYCSYWDEQEQKWQVDGAGEFALAEGGGFIANCPTTHFTGAHLASRLFTSLSLLTQVGGCCRLWRFPRPVATAEPAGRPVGPAKQPHRLQSHPGHARHHRRHVCVWPARVPVVRQGGNIDGHGQKVFLCHSQDPAQGPA